MYSLAQYCFFRTSAGNCARIYNTGLALKSLSPSLPVSFSSSEHITLDVEDVWDGLLLYWVLEDAQERREGWLMMHPRRPSAFNLHYVPATFAWLALGRKPGTMLVTFAVGFKHCLMERKVCYFMLLLLKY